MEQLAMVLAYFQLTVTAEDLKHDAIARANVLGLIRDAITDELAGVAGTEDDYELAGHYRALASFYEAISTLTDMDVLDEPGPESTIDVPDVVGDINAAKAITDAATIILADYGVKTGWAVTTGNTPMQPIQHLRLYYEEFPDEVPEEVMQFFLAQFYDTDTVAYYMEEAVRTWNR
ncbi:hypothetical protein D3C76_965210 [compost metagenome]